MKRTIPLEIGDRKLELAFTFAALESVEKQLSLSLANGLDLGGLTPVVTAKLLYLAAAGQEPGLTQADIDALPVDATSFQEIKLALGRAWYGEEAFNSAIKATQEEPDPNATSQSQVAANSGIGTGALPESTSDSPNASSGT